MWINMLWNKRDGFPSGSGENTSYVVETQWGSGCGVNPRVMSLSEISLRMHGGGAGVPTVMYRKGGKANSRVHLFAQSYGRVYQMFPFGLLTTEDCHATRVYHYKEFDTLLNYMFHLQVEQLVHRRMG